MVSSFPHRVPNYLLNVYFILSRKPGENLPTAETDGSSLQRMKPQVLGAGWALPTIPWWFHEHVVSYLRLNFFFYLLMSLTPPSSLSSHRTSPTPVIPLLPIGSSPTPVPSPLLPTGPSPTFRSFCCVLGLTDFKQGCLCLCL